MTDKESLASTILELIQAFKERTGEKVNYATYWDHYGTVNVGLESDDKGDPGF